MQIAISTLDVADDAQVDAVHRVLTAARAHDVPDFPPPCRYHLYGMFRHPVSHTRGDYVVAWLDGRIVGLLGLSMPLRDNVENSEMDLTVDPAYRRRGVGSALYERGVQTLRRDGRKRVAGMATEPLAGGVPRDDAGNQFAAAMGAKNAMLDVRRRLELSTVDDARLAEMLAAAWHRAGGYRFIRWNTRTPDEHTADVGYLDARLVTDAPMGDLVWEPEKIDTARIREGEAAREARGIRTYTGGMVHEHSGRLVALTAIGMERSHPHHATQWITIVDPDHRGHRLGTVVKLENLAFIRSHEPELSTIDTWNADTNGFMIDINEAMGFRPVDAWVNWQAEL